MTINLISDRFVLLITDIKIIFVVMWDIDLNYREEFQTTFNRLYEKASFAIHRPCQPSP
jgi:hypothetical protein